MNDREFSPGEGTDEQLVRAHLSGLVEEVQPAPGSLSRVLAGRRRRRVPGRPALVGAGVVIAAVAAVLAVVVPSPDPAGSGPRAVGTGTDSYVTQVRSGVLARVELGSGGRVGEFAALPGRVTSVATDGERVYAAVSGRRQQIYELVTGHVPEVVATATGDVPLTDLTVAHGRIAYVRGESVVVRDGAETRTIRAPGRPVDLALAANGRPVLLTEPGDGTRQAALRIAVPGGAGWSGVRTGLGCAPLAVASIETEVAALYRVGCRPGAPVRVATLRPATGERVSAGTPFDAGPRIRRGDVHLSAGRLGRYLVTVPGGGRWLVDGALVRALPPPCGPGGACLGAPSAL